MDNIEQNFAFFQGSGAWHGKGQIINNPNLTPAEAWALAYPFTVHQLPVRAVVTDANGQDHYTTCGDHMAIVRSDGKVLSVMSARYGVVQPQRMFSAFEGLLSSGLVQLESGGSLADGRKLWALGKIACSAAEILPGDKIEPYLLFHGSYDGSCKLGAGLTAVRVVCQNTLAQAVQAGLSHSTKHTKNVNDRLDQIVADLDQVVRAWASSVESYRHLANTRVSRTAQEEFITKIIAPEILSKPEAEISTKTKNKVRTVIDLLDTQKGLSLVPAARGTAWQAYNAVTEYLTHEAGRTADSRTDSLWFGDGFRDNRAALALAATM